MGERVRLFRPRWGTTRGFEVDPWESSGSGNECGTSSWRARERVSLVNHTVCTTSQGEARRNLVHVCGFRDSDFQEGSRGRLCEMVKRIDQSQQAQGRGTLYYIQQQKEIHA